MEQLCDYVQKEVTQFGSSSTLHVAHVDKAELTWLHEGCVVFIKDIQYMTEPIQT